MTESVKLTGASSGLGKNWNSINWSTINANVQRLQMRIAKAVVEKRWNKVKSLQWLLTHSIEAKLLAVRRVTSRKGARTPGVDNVRWNTPARKMRGALSLQSKGYKALPLRRILIPKGKGSGKFRPLGIPTLKDRAMQALYLLALEPVSETLADPNLYGFRKYRGCRDAIAQCFCALAKKDSPRWILEADIKACFDWIDHEWLLENICLDKKILKQWLKCGYFENNKLYPTQSGTPQGGVISPTLANMALDGLEQAVRKVWSRKTKINFVRYADDFIITASSKEVLTGKVLPIVKEFLSKRGLTLSEEKTKITRIEDGFDFLGQNIRKFNNKYHAEPSKGNIKAFYENVRNVIKSCRGSNAEKLITKLNPVVRGWANYHKYVQSSRIFAEVEMNIYYLLNQWARRKHGNKTPKWIRNHYRGKSHDRKHFSCTIKRKDGSFRILELVKVNDIKLHRYIKIKGTSNPFNFGDMEYFKGRRIKEVSVPISKII